MGKDILDTIYKKLVYPSEEIQKIFSESEKRVAARWNEVSESELNREEVHNIFLEEEDKIRQELFVRGMKYGVKLCNELSVENH